MAKKIPNQKIITINKVQCDEQHLYTKINLDALNQAAIKLKAGAFKLWIYMAKNQNGYAFGLSNIDVKNSFGMGKDQYDTAVKELIENNYLVSVEGQNYIFNELPLQEKPTMKTAVGKTHNEISLFEKPTTDVMVKNYNENLSLQEKTTTEISTLQENQTTTLSEKPLIAVGESNNTLQENPLRNIINITSISQEDIITLRYSEILEMFEEGTYRIEGTMCYKDDGKVFKVKFDF